MTELTTEDGSDILYIVDDPASGKLSRKITVDNLFDAIDTSAELSTYLTDEEGSGAAVFATDPTFTTAISFNDDAAIQLGTGDPAKIAYSDDTTRDSLQIGMLISGADDGSINIMEQGELGHANRESPNANTHPTLRVWADGTTASHYTELYHNTDSSIFLSGTGKWAIGGVGGSFNENITLDFETTEDTVAFGTGTGAKAQYNIPFDALVDIFIGNKALSSGQLSFLEDTDNGIEQFNITIPSDLAANVTLTLPPNDGTAGQVLSTDGSGVLTWEDDATGGSPTLDSIGDPVAVTTLVSSATAETVSFDFQSAFTTGSQFVIKSSTGNPTGGDLMEIEGHDADIVSNLRIDVGGDVTQAAGIIFETSGGASAAFTDAIDASDAGIVNALDAGSNNIVIGGDTINEFAGDGLTVSANALTADLGTSIVTGEITDGTITQPDIDDTGTLASNSYVADAVWFGVNATPSGGIIFEGDTDNTIETILIATDPTATDKTITLPNITGTVALLEGTQTFSGVKTISSNWVNTANPWAVNEGGSGAATFTANGALYGNGTSAFQVTAAHTTNGSLLIGDGSGVPTVATISNGTDTTVVNGAGTIQIDVNDAFVQNDTSDVMTGTLTADGLTLGSTELITLGDETISSTADDMIEFQGVGGADNTDLRIDLDGTGPVIDSPTDTTITVSDTLDATTLTEGGVAVYNDDEMDTKAELEGIVTDVSDFAMADGDTYSGAHDFDGTVTSFIIPNDANPTTLIDATGEIAMDTTITSHNGYIKYYDGTTEMVIPAIPTADLTATDNHIIKFDLGNTKFTMEADADSGGATAYDNIGDPTSAGSITFDDTETATYATAEDGGTFFNINGTDSDLAVNTTLLQVTTSANDDAQYIPFRIADDSGGDNDTLFQVASDGQLTVGEGGTTIPATAKYEITINAASLKGTSVNGAGDASQLPESRADGSHAKGLNYDYMAFDSATDQSVYWSMSLPGWDGGTITFRYKWTNTSGAATEDVAIGMRAIGLGNDEILQVSQSDWGADVENTDFWLAQNDLHVSGESSALTVGSVGSLEDTDLIHFQAFRDVGIDDMTGDADILEFIITYTRDMYSDV